MNSLLELVGAHVKLAKAELQQNAKDVGKELAKVIAFVPLILVGYLLLMVALSIVIGRALSFEAGFAIVGGVHVVGGALGVLWAVKAMGKTEPLEHTRSQLSESVEVVRSVTQGPPNQKLERVP
ncbi:MAG: phage holin family protein [Myxococcaceae bacterium]